MPDRVQIALRELAAGRIIIIIDDADRENEGDLVLAAEHVTPEKMAFIIQHTGGVVFLALSGAIADKLDLPLMVEHNTSPRRTAFTVSIDAAEGTTTGISAADRAETVRAAMRLDAKPSDLVRPGHLFPLRAKEGGVLERNGHTEASVDLCKLAGLRAGAVGSELMNADGTMMRGATLERFAADNHLSIVSVAEVVAYRREMENK